MRILKYAMCALIMLGSWSDSIAQDNQEPQPFKRNLEQVSFIPKGQWITGISANYSQTNSNNYQFFVVENLNGNRYSYNISPMLMYAFSNDLAAGARFVYSRQMTKLNSGNVKFNSETDFGVENLYSINHNYYATAAFRNYISMGNSKRFGFFNEVQLQVGGGQSKLCSGLRDDLTGTYEKNFSVDVTLSPGVVMFLNNYTALEVNVGIVGFGYNHTESVTDQIYVADRKSNMANFKLNLMSISFGVAFYL